MDNLTHTLCGIMLGRAGLRRAAPGATAILILAANAPDADLLSMALGAEAYLRSHRGMTHSVVATPAMALLPALLVGLLLWRGNREQWRRHFAKAYLISLAGVASHWILDWTNVYGVRLLEPFSSRWMRADLFPIADPWIFTIFLMALAGPALSKLVSLEIGARSGGYGSTAARLALSFLVFYGLGRWILHERAQATLQSRIYQGRPPLRTAAFPTFFNPLRWTGLVETQEGYLIYPLDLRDPFDPAAGKVFHRAECGPAIEAARRTKIFQTFLMFSQYPLWRTLPATEPSGATWVHLTDLRFGAPPASRFNVTATVDGQGRVLTSSFVFGLVKSPGR